MKGLDNLFPEYTTSPHCCLGLEYLISLRYNHILPYLFARIKMWLSFLIVDWLIGKRLILVAPAAYQTTTDSILSCMQSTADLRGTKLSQYYIASEWFTGANTLGTLLSHLSPIFSARISLAFC